MSLEDRRQRMAELEAQGLSRRAIAQEMGCTAPRVTQVLGPRKKYKTRAMRAKEELSEQTGEGS